MNQKERLELAKWAMNYALKHGANQASVGMFNQREVSIEYRDKRLEELKESTQNSLNIFLLIHPLSSNTGTRPKAS